MMILLILCILQKHVHRIKMIKVRATYACIILNIGNCTWKISIVVGLRQSLICSLGIDKKKLSTADRLCCFGVLATYSRGDETRGSI